MTNKTKKGIIGAIAIVMLVIFLVSTFLGLLV